jgi:hypothetical protein
MRCEVRNKMTLAPILSIDKMVFVNVNAEGKTTPHGKTKIEYVKDRLGE